MQVNPIQIVPLLFLLSLVAAFLLFKFLDSKAEIVSKGYKAGGAIAGFIIVYGMLYGSFYKISGAQEKLEEQKNTIEELQSKISERDKFQQVRQFQGTIEPYSEHTKVVLAVTESDIQDPINRRFRLSAQCVDLIKGKFSLYVLRAGRVYPYEIFPEDDISALKIPVPDSN